MPSPSARPSPPSPPGRPRASSGATPQRPERGQRDANDGRQQDGAQETPAGRDQAQARGQGQAGDASETADGQPNRDAEGTPGDDGWETSNELPQVLGDLASEGRKNAGAGGQERPAGQGPDGQEQGGEAGDGEDLTADAGQPGGEAGDGEDQTAAAGQPAGEGGGANKTADGEQGAGDVLARALEDLDGEIRDERVAATDGAPRPNASPGAGQDGQASSSGDGQGASQSGGGAMPGRGTVASSMPPTPRPPLPATPDTPDARDDDVVARQLREAALAETDPELREALWEELERYKSGLRRR